MVIKVSHQQELREGLDAPESDDGLPISLVKAAAREQTNLEAEVITNQSGGEMTNRLQDVYVHQFSAEIKNVMLRNL